MQYVDVDIDSISKALFSMALNFIKKESNTKELPFQYCRLEVRFQGF